MPKVIYIRHGESESNKIIHDNKKLTNEHEEQIKCFLNPNLTNLGSEQANKTGDYLYKILKNKYKKIYVWISPYNRTQQTAKPFLQLSQDLPVESNIMPDLYEYTSNNKQPNDELIKLGINNDITWNHFINRVIKFNIKLKEKMLKMHEDEILLIFGHSLFFSVLMAYQTVQEKDAEIDDITFELPNCCLSTIGYNTTRKRWSIYNVASVSHLNKNLVTGNHTLIGLCIN